MSMSIGSGDNDVVGWLMSSLLVLVAILLGWRLFSGAAGRNRGRRLPGPLANHIPLVGALPLLATKDPHLALCQMARKYGKIFRLELGSATMVVIADHKLFRETFKRSDMTRRSLPPSLDVMDGLGIIHANGEMWKNQRDFVHKVLRHLGMVRSGARFKVLFEERATSAVSAFLDEVAATGGASFDIDPPLSFTILNLFLSTVTSTPFVFGDPDILAMIQSSHDSFRIQKIMTSANFIPLLRRLPAFKSTMATVMQRREDCRNFFRKIIAARRKFRHESSTSGRTASPGNGNSPDLIDAFLSQMEEDQREGNTCSHFTEVQLLSILGDLSSAGLETTKTTIQWLLLALLNKPHIQAKIQEELDSVSSECPSLEDRPRLPYVEATIQETFRFSSILPVGLGHNGIEDTTIDGYHIPREASVTGLMWKFHHDEEFWPNPDDFDPENQLDEEGRLKRCDYLMPFSTGRRICLGEEIARNEIFLLLTGLLKRFRFEPSDNDVVEGKKGNNLPSLHESITGILRSPLPFHIRAIPRLP